MQQQQQTETETEKITIYHQTTELFLFLRFNALAVRLASCTPELCVHQQQQVFLFQFIILLLCTQK